jgi:hypothetical protein
MVVVVSTIVCFASSRLVVTSSLCVCNGGTSRLGQIELKRGLGTEISGALSYDLS